MNSPILELADKRRELRLLHRQRALKRDYGIHFYKPHYKQNLFHSAGDFPRRYVRTGNRFGKSQMGAAEDIAWCMGYRPWYEEGDPRRYVGIPPRPVKGCIVVQDWDKATEVFTSTEDGAGRGKIFQLLPKDLLVGRPSTNHSGNIDCIRIQSKWGGTSSLYFETVKSFMSNRLGTESSDWDFLHIDEPCPRDMWIALSRGLMDRGGSAWFTCTPLTEMWINDLFIPPKRFRDTFDRPFVSADDGLRKWIITGSTRDNPHVREQDIKAFESDLDDDEKECRISGVPRALSGVVYKQFDRTIHVYSDTPKGWEAFNRPPKSYTIRVLIDVHPKEPQAALFFATSPQGITFIYDEIYDIMLIPDLAEQILDLVSGYKVESFQVDPIAFTPHPITGECWADDMENVGLPVEQAPKQKERGISRTKAKFKDRTTDGFPTLMVSEACTEFLFEIDRYVWDPHKKGEVTIDIRDHMMENLYRGVLSGLTYVNPQPAPYKPPPPMDLTHRPASVRLDTRLTSGRPHSRTSRRYYPKTDSGYVH